MIAAIFLMLILCAPPSQAQPERLRGVSEVWGRYISPDLPEHGFLVALASRTLAESGRVLDFSFYPWARALAMVRNGSADLLIGAYRTEERLAWFAYSDPLAEVPDSIFVRADSGITFSSLNDLRPYTIGVVRGAAHGQAFDGATFLKKEEADSTLRNVQKLLTQRVDAIIGPRENILDVVETRFPDSKDRIVALDPPIQLNTIHIAVSLKRQDALTLIAAINRSLAKLKADGTYARLEQRYGMALRF